MERIYRIFKAASLLFVGAIIIFFILEGATSSMLVLDSILEPLNKKPSNRQTCLIYDPLLGWSFKPNVKMDNFFYEKDFTIINAQGFRNRENFEHKIPEEKIRIMCSGDSFTFGYGVNNDETWCAFLEKRNPRIEVLNMGVPGYGIDQIYLRYIYDGLPFKHNIHLFAFDTWDFDRSQKATFCGLNKPQVRLEGEELVVTNVPVPPGKGPFIQTLMEHLGELKSVEFTRRLLDKLLADSFKKHFLKEKTMSDEEIKHASIKMLERLDRLNRKKGSVFVAVYLPTEDDYGKEINKSSELRSFFSNELKKREIRYIDLVEVIGEEPAIMLKERIYGHYTPGGNKFIADALYEKMLAFPEIARALKGNKEE